MTVLLSPMCLPLNAWPQLDQVLWTSVTHPGNILDDETPRAASWRNPTKEKVRKGYGRWLHFLSACDHLDTRVHPADRITLDHVRPYVEMLQGQVAAETTWSYVTSLHQVAQIFAPDRDWGWLYRITAKLKARSKPTKLKLPRMRDGQVILEWALTEMTGIQSQSDRRPSCAVAYRNALMIGILITCPVRLRNLVMVRIDHHLKRIRDQFYLNYIPNEVKNNRYLAMEIPAAVTPFLESWLNIWRPGLCENIETAELWIDIRGGILGQRGVYSAITKTTKRVFGAPINPHLFRDIAATSTAVVTPESIGIAGSILGHLTPQAVEDHYIHANQIAAGRLLRQSIIQVRNTPAPQNLQNRRSL